MKQNKELLDPISGNLPPNIELLGFTRIQYTSVIEILIGKMEINAQEDAMSIM